MSEKYYGNYIGIVITNPALDPEGRNRAQVWVPSITNTLYKGWNNNTTDSKEITEEMMIRLKNSLPWAECASPLIGGGAPFFANSATGIYSDNPEVTVLYDDNTQEPFDPLEQLPPVSTETFEDPTLPRGANEPPVDPNLDIAPEPEEPLESLGPASQVSLNNASAEPADTGTDSFGNVEPELPEDDSVVVPTSPTTSDERGEPITPAKTKPSYGGYITETPGKYRRLPLSSGLKSAISTALAGTGINWKSTSGGQWPVGVIDPETGKQGSRYGTTTNHDWGNASDGEFIDTRTGNAIDARTPEGQAIIESLLPRLRQAGIKGVGWDDVGYMDDPLKWHLDIVNPSVWGDGGKSANAAPWVKAALDGVPQGQVAAANQISEESTPSQPDDFIIGNSSVPHGGAGTATGTFSTISHLAKVWVFFYGGDIQRPVYFAQVTDPSSISQELINNPSRVNTLLT